MSATIGRVVVEERPPAVLLGLHRPEKRNALDVAFVAELEAALAAYRRRPCVLIVHSLVPGVFAAGADLGELKERRADDALAAINAGLFARLGAHRWPTVALVDGPAIGGGCELALACDLRIGTPRSRFSQPEPALGILAGAGANWRLPAVVGQQVARRMLYLGEVLDAETALTAGLLDRLVRPEEALEVALEVARRIATRSWRALELTKLALSVGDRPSTQIDLVAQALLFESDDAHRRLDAALSPGRARGAAHRPVPEDDRADDAAPSGGPADDDRAEPPSGGAIWRGGEEVARRREAAAHGEGRGDGRVR